MPHGESWFTVLFAGLVQKAQQAAHALGNENGKTWLMNEHIGVEHVFGAAFVVLILTIVGFVVSNRLRNPREALVPEDRLTVRTAVELIVGSTYKMMSDMMGAKAARYFLPLIGTLALFILLSNVLGLVPGFLPPTGNLNTTLAPALVVLIATHFYGFKEHGVGYFKHFLGPVPWLIPLLLPLETMTHLAIRPGTLAIRLMANMTADHRVLEAFLGFGPISLIPFPVAIYLLGVIVVTVQTLVFCLLSTVYISLSISHEEH
jgi:F-type H+-transporting ATPase subunit a